MHCHPAPIYSSREVCNGSPYDFWVHMLKSPLYIGISLVYLYTAPITKASIHNYVATTHALMILRLLKLISQGIAVPMLRGPGENPISYSQLQRQAKLFKGYYIPMHVVKLLPTKPLGQGQEWPPSKLTQPLLPAGQIGSPILRASAHSSKSVQKLMIIAAYN